MSINIICIVFLIIEMLSVHDNASFNHQSNTENGYSDAIKKINYEYQKINADSNMIVVEKKLNSFSTEGSRVIGYYNRKGDLRKADLFFYGEMGKKKEEYYYRNNKPIIIIQRFFIYDKPIYIDGSKIIEEEEYKYYFYRGKTIEINKSNTEAIILGNEKVKKNVEELQNRAIAILDMKECESYHFSGSGCFETILPLSMFKTEIKIEYSFYEIPDQIIISNKSEKHIFKTDLMSTTTKQTKLINTTELSDCDTLILRINTHIDNSKWDINVNIK
ncbi:MAG: hypothetical protein ACOCVN_01905 [bacterium]